MPTGATTRETMNGPDSEPAGLGQIFLELVAGSPGAIETPGIYPSCCSRAAKVRRAASSFAVASLNAVHASSDRNTATETNFKQMSLE